MGKAWEVTVEDVQNVLNRMGHVSTDSIAEMIFEDLNFDHIEAAALWGSDLDEQTQRAYDEIRRQILERTPGDPG